MKKLIYILLLFPSFVFAQAATNLTDSEQFYIVKAREDLKNKDYKSSIENYTAAINLNPKNVLSYVNRATAKWDLKDNEGAIEDFKLAIALNGKYSWIYYNDIGLIKMDEKDDKGAISAYSKSIKLYPSGPTYNNRALAELANSDYSAAIKDLTIALNNQNGPNLKASPSAYLVKGNQYSLRGKAEMLNGDTKAAINDLDTAININPKLALAYNTRGEAKNRSGDKDGACADWKTAVGLGNDDAKENINKYCGK